MIPRAPRVPLFELGKSEPKWITREQAHTLLGRLPRQYPGYDDFRARHGITEIERGWT